MPPVPPPTPPQTQPPPTSTTTDAIGTEFGMDDMRRHERFYETGGSLLDPVILKVKDELAIDEMTENTDTY